MTQPDRDTNLQADLRRYLYGEMAEAERNLFEEKMLADDVLYYNAADLENDLVDAYAAGKLVGDELIRFEQSLVHFPARRSKIANATALRQLTGGDADGSAVVRDENPGVGIWEKLSGLFIIRSPVFGAAVAVLLIAATGASIFLYLENRRALEQIARLQNEREINEREDELRAHLANKEQESDELVRNLDAEQARIRQLELELQKISGTNHKLPPTRSSDHTIASLVLGGREPDRNGGGARTASIGENTTKLAVNLTIAGDVRADDKISIELNGKPFAQNVSIHVSENGKKNFSIMVPRDRLKLGANKIIVNNSAGQKISEYDFRVDEPRP